VDTDQPLKALFRMRRRDLLGISGDHDVRVVSVGVYELTASRRSVDTVLRLRRRGGEEYLRHVEFEARYRRGLELRLFEYAARLAVQFRLPVATTVIFLHPPAPREMAYREMIGGRVVLERRFDVVRLWEIEPRRLLAMGAGPAALVGLLRDSRPDHVRNAVQLIRRSTRPPERHDLMYVLHALSSERYTPRELEQMIPKGAVMGSGMFAKELRQARAEGRAEAVRSIRQTCADIVRRFHPALVERVAPAIEACDSLPTLRKWTMAATELSDDEFASLVTGVGKRVETSVSRQRVPRPARRTAARRRR
jgi:hypothetical protein